MTKKTKPSGSPKADATDKKTRPQHRGAERMKPTVPEVLPLVRKLYARHGDGCCLHVVLDDNNYDSVQFCLDYAKEINCQECTQLAEKLSQMSYTQIRKLCAIK